MAARGRLGPGGGAPGLAPRIVCISGPSGVGKTRLLLRLIAELTARGLRIAAVKHTRHAHALDVPGKDTERYRRAGAVAAAISGPRGMAFFGPPIEDPAALVRVLPRADLVLAEGFRSAPLPRIEVHRRSISPRFLCARDPHVFLVVGDGPPPIPIPLVGPDEVERVAELLCRRLGLKVHSRLPLRRPMRSVPAGRSHRTLRRAQGRPLREARGSSPRRAQDGGLAPGRSTMPKTTSRRTSGRSTKRSRSDAGRKGGRATLRARGPEFFSEIGRKGGKSRSRRAAAARRSRATKRGLSGKPRSRGRGRGRTR